MMMELVPDEVAEYISPAGEGHAVQQHWYCHRAYVRVGGVAHVP